VDQIKIEKYENIARSYGNLSLSFLEKLIRALSDSNSESVIMQLVDTFLEELKMFSDNLIMLLGTDECELFAGNLRPVIGESRRHLLFGGAKFAEKF
jgi:hypothetical protein